MAFNRLKELSKNIDNELYLVFLDIIKKIDDFLLVKGLGGFNWLQKFTKDYNRSDNLIKIFMIKNEFSSILWEYDLEKLDYKSDVVFVRSLTLWDKNHTDILKKELWIDEFRNKFIKNIESLDKKTINYWGLIFWIDVKKYLSNNQNTYEKLNKPIFTRNFG